MDLENILGRGGKLDFYNANGINICLSTKNAYKYILKILVPILNNNFKCGLAKTIIL